MILEGPPEILSEESKKKQCMINIDFKRDISSQLQAIQEQLQLSARKFFKSHVKRAAVRYIPIFTCKYVGWFVRRLLITTKKDTDVKLGTHTPLDHIQNFFLFFRKSDCGPPPSKKFRISPLFPGFFICSF